MAAGEAGCADQAGAVMPVFEIQTERGIFQIDAPNQNEALRALDSLPPEPENSIGGAAKALGSGLAEGAIGIAGLPADAVDLATRGIDALAGTKTNESVAGVKRFGSESIKKTIEGLTGEFYKPKTGLESAISTTASFAPAVLVGPGSIARRVATNVIAPGLASEAAGQLAAGTDLEPVARVAGALAGAAGAGKAAQTIANRSAVPAVPSSHAIDAAKTDAYNTAAVKELRIAPAAVEKVLDRAAKLGKDEYLNAPQTYAQLELMKKPMNGPNFSMLDLENGRKALGELRALPGAEGRAASAAVKYLDNVIPHIGKIPGAVVKGDARAAAADLRAARANAAANFRSEMVTGFIERARNTAAATHSGGNLENEIYKQIRNALNNPRKHLSGWTAEEKEALRAVLPGVGRGMLRRVGKLLGGGGGLGQLASGGAGAATFGLPGAFALPAIGLAANKLGTSITMNKIGKVDELLRSRSPLYGPGNQSLRQSMLRGGIMQGLPSREQAVLYGLLASSPQRAN